jgi:hypothetical protein
MDVKLLFGIASTIVAILTFVPYLRDIFKNKTKPHAYSWLVWTILQIVGVSAAFKQGAGYGAWGLTIGAIFCLIIFLLSLKYGTKNIKKFDKFCLIGAILAIALYLFLADPLLAVIVVALIDLVGFLPTMRKGYEEPSTETPSAYALAAFANLLSLIAIQNYTMVTVLYVASLLLTNSVMVAIILIPRQKNPTLETGRDA